MRNFLSSFFSQRTLVFLLLGLLSVGRGLLAADTAAASETLRVEDYLEILEEGSLPSEGLHWESSSGKEFTFPAGGTPYVNFVGTTSDGWKFEGEGAEFTVDGSQVKARLELPARPNRIVFHLTSPKGETFTYSATYLWKKQPAVAVAKAEEAAKVEAAVAAKGETLRASEYIETLALGSFPSATLKWDAASQRDILLPPGEAPYLLLAGKTGEGWKFTVEGAKVKTEADGHFQVRIALLLKPNRFKFIAKGPKGESLSYGITYVWKKHPPALAFKVREEDEVIKYSSGVNGEFDSAPYSQLVSWDKPTDSVSTEFGGEADLYFRTYLPPETSLDYKGWSFSIRDGKNEVVGTLEGAGVPPERIAWLDLKPNVALGQTYRYCMEAKSSAPAKKKACAGVENSFEVVSGEIHRMMFSLAPKFSFFTMQAFDKTNGSNGTVNSGANFGLDLGASYRLNRRLEPFAQFSFNRIDVAPFSSKSLETQTKVLLNGRAGMLFHLGKRWTMSAIAGYGQQLVIRGTSQNDLTLDSATVPSLGYNASYLVYRGSLYAVRAEVGASVYFSTRTDFFQFDNGYDYYGRVGVTRAVGPLQAFGAVSVTRGTINTSIVNQTPTDFGLNVGVRFPLGF